MELHHKKIFLYLYKINLDSGSEKTKKVKNDCP